MCCISLIFYAIVLGIIHRETYIAVLFLISIVQLQYQFCNVESGNIICNIYSTVGRSIADISDPRRHIYQVAKRQGKYAAKVGYTGYRPTYGAIYTIEYGECATDEPFA